MKPSFGPGRGVRPNKTSAPSCTSTDGPDSPLNQHLQPIFKHKVNGARILYNNITADTPHYGDCDIHKILPLITSITLHDDTLLILKNFMTSLPCYSLPPSNNLTKLSSLNSIPRIFQMALLILQMVEKATTSTTNALFPESSSVFLKLPSIGKTKTIQPLQTFLQNLMSGPSTWLPKWSNGSAQSYKT